MNPLFILLPVLNLGSALLITRQGRAADIWGAWIFVGALALTITLYVLDVPYPVVWTLIVDVLLFLVFWYLAERAGRWWMVAMAGTQLAAALTCLAPLLAWQQLVPAFVAVHWFVGVVDAGILIFANMEIRLSMPPQRPNPGLGKPSDGAAVVTGHSQQDDPRLGR